MPAQPKKLLALLAGPHRDGATAAMLDCAVRAAESAGWEARRVFLYEKDLALCTGCRRCTRTGLCVRQDDIRELTALWTECGAVILAAPTYWANVPAALKNLFDRMLGPAMEDTRRFPKPRAFAGKRYQLLTSCKTPFPFSVLAGQSTGALRAMKEFCRTAGMKCMGCAAYPGADTEGRPGAGSGGAGTPALPPRVRRKIERCWK